MASLATNEHEFDVLASVAETGSANEVEGITPHQLSALVDHFPEAEELEDLEIGVAGLVYALAAAGIYPAASCRGHTDPNPWSKSPVVFFAADRSHAEALQSSSQRDRMRVWTSIVTGGNARNNRHVSRRYSRSRPETS